MKPLNLPYAVRRQTQLPLSIVTVLTALSAIGASSAWAGTITSITTFSLPGASTGNLGAVGANPAPNNDNATGASPNTIPYSIFYNAGGVGIAEAEYVITNSGGTTEYRFTQTLVNNTGQVWQGFFYELGFGTGANFVRSSALDGLDFDTPNRDPSPTSSVFTVLDHQDDTLSWSGGSVNSIGVLAQSFSVDVPDSLSTFNPSGQNRFTIRQVQVTANPIPEPSEWMTLGVASASVGGLMFRARRRQRNKNFGVTS